VFNDLRSEVVVNIDFPSATGILRLNFQILKLKF
jgi:hypothetical protein